jgi:hypothetical protein
MSIGIKGNGEHIDHIIDGNVGRSFENYTINKGESRREQEESS